MLYLVNVISNVVKDGFRRIKHRRLGTGDVQDVRQATPFGVDSVPLAKMVGVYSETGKKGKAVIIGYLNASLLAQTGEIRIFAQDSNGEVATYIWCKADGVIELGGNTKHLARYEELKAGFDQLKSDHNNLVTKFNAHIHGGVTAGAASTAPILAPQQGAASIASIDSSKIDEIKTL
jgi:hypothetical protein